MQLPKIQHTIIKYKLKELTAFSGLKALSTRLVNALETTDATAQVIKDAKGFNRKLQGKRASTATTPIDPNTPAPATISTSQQSYDQQIQHLAGLTSVLISEPSYAPNETALATATLTALQANLTAKNNEVATAYNKHKQFKNCKKQHIICRQHRIS